jgi:hypothetical protein
VAVVSVRIVLWRWGGHAHIVALRPGIRCWVIGLGY